MFTMSQNEAVWRNDGHEMTVTLHGSNCHLQLAKCPEKDAEDADCYSKEAEGCIVRWFLDMYGLDCNVGIAPAQPRMDIAWTRMGGETLSDSQVWIMPSEDEAFKGWIDEMEKDLSGD